MSKRHASNSAANVQLFPFLAVLLCAMGALILLLVIITGKAREEGIELRHAALEQRLELLGQRKDLEWQHGMIEQARDATAAQLAAHRAALASAEDEVRRLRDEQAELEAAIARIDQQSSSQSDDAAELRSRLKRFEADTIAAEADLDRKRKARRHTQDSYAIVPYEGPHATRRRPIYIECTSNAVVLQPEGIRLGEQDFMAADGPNNPLAAALRAAREYLISIRYQGGRDNGDPYPLLLVRPSGIGAYYAARAAMTSWGTEFGYELIEDDWQIEYLPSDSGLSIAMNRAIQDSRQRTVVIASAAPGLRQHNDREIYREAFAMNRRGGSAVSGGATDRVGRGGNSSRGGGDFSNSFAANSGRERRAPIMSGGSPNNPGGSAPSAASGSRDGAITAYGGPSPYDEIYNGGYAPPTGTGLPGGVGLPLGMNGAGSPGAAASASGGGSPPGGGNQASGGQSITGPAFPGGAIQPGGAGSPTAAGQVGQVSPAGEAVAPREGSSSGVISTPARYASTRNGDAPPNHGDPAPFGGSDPYLNQGQTASNTSGAAQPSPFSTTGRTYAQQQGAGGQGSATSSTEQGAAPSPSLTMNAKPPRQPAKSSLAKSRGRNWGLPETARGAVPITRPIQVLVTADMLTLLSERGSTAPSRVVRFGARTEDSIDELVNKIWEHIGSWNIAGQGMYWRPVLVVQIASDGVDRYADLQTLLADSGLEVTVKPSNTPVRR